MAFSQSINGLAIEQPRVTISLTKSSDEMFKIPRNCYENLFVERVVEGSRNIFWSAPIDFKLPEDSMDLILKRDENVKSTRGVLHLPLAERLGGWKIEKRQRLGVEIYDKYFYHNQSGKMFRTFREVARFIKDASLPRKAPECNNAQNQGLMALEAFGSEPLEAASFEETDRKVNNSAFFPLLRVAESLERDKKRRRGEKLQYHDKQKETGKGKEKEKEKEKGSSSSEEVTPHLTPERGSECLRRFNNKECNMSQGVKENAGNDEESQVEGGSITIIPDLFIPDEDLVGLDNFGCVNNND